MGQSQTPELWGVFHVEPVNGCPNNCEACASSNGLYLMDDATMEWAIQQMATFKGKFVNTRLSVKLFGTGEGVLHPCLGRFASRIRTELNPDFLTLSTNIKTLQKFGPDLPPEVAVVVASRLDDVFDDATIARYGHCRLSILVPDATDATAARIAEILDVWPNPSTQLVKMCDLEIPRKGKDHFVRRELPFSDLPPFKDELIAKLTSLSLAVVNEFDPSVWNVRATLRYDRTIDACLMRSAPFPFDFGSDEFYQQYFPARKEMCASCPHHHGIFNLSVQKTTEEAEVRRVYLEDKGVPAEIVEGVRT